MNKKGFTLIELIATIGLLAIIAIIAFVSINKVIIESKAKNCESLINNLKTIAKEYVSDNRYNNNGPNNFVDLARNAIENNDKIDITNILKQEKYIKDPIVDPINNVEVTDKIHISVFLKPDYSVDIVDIEIDRDDGITPGYTPEEWCQR